MKHSWVPALNAKPPLQFYSSPGCRRRAEAVVGQQAVWWAVNAGQRMAQAILDGFSDWSGSRDEDEVDILRRAAEASSVDSLAALCTGDCAWLARSVEPNENAVFYASQGIPLDQVIRNVHAGQQFLLDELLHELDALVTENDRMNLARALHSDISSCWSQLAQSVSHTYEAERKRLDSDLDSRRDEAIRTILAGQGSSEDEAVVQRGYQVDAWQRAFVVWLQDSDPDTFLHLNFARIAEQIARLTKANNGYLLYGSGIRQVSIWVSSTSPVSVKDLDSSGTWPSKLRIAAGEPAYGMAGFRTSQQQAQATERVARLSAAPRFLTRH